MSFVIRFIYKDEKETADDVLSFAKDKRTNMFNVTFRPGDFKKTKYTTFMSFGRLLDHVENILHSLGMDRDPLHRVQVMSPLQPTIMYDIEDILDEETTKNIMDAVMMYVRSNVERENE